MKSGAKVRRIQLVDTQSNNSALIGIVSAEPDYKISLAINRKLKIALKHDHPLAISTKENESLIFSRFSDSGASHDQNIDLTSNRYGKEFLVKKLRNIDYILQVHSPGNEASIRKMIASLKEIEGITAVLIIDRTAIKDKNLEYIIQ
jgi:hypothetical protein